MVGKMAFVKVVSWVDKSGKRMEDLLELETVVKMVETSVVLRVERKVVLKDVWWVA